MGVDVTRVLSSAASSGTANAENYRESDALSFTKEQADALLEAAYLSAAANGDLSDAELVNFRALVPRVVALAGEGHVASSAQTKEPSNEEIRALLDRFDANLRHTDVPGRLQALARILTQKPQRELTYKIAFALSICDLATDDDEADFLDDLCEALDLAATVDRLTAEVYEALDEGADDEPA